MNIAELSLDTLEALEKKKTFVVYEKDQVKNFSSMMRQKLTAVFKNVDGLVTRAPASYAPLNERIRSLKARSALYPLK